jgi:hypothetical protein
MARRASRSEPKSKVTRPKRTQSARRRTQNANNDDKSKYFDTDSDENDLSFDEDDLEDTDESESSFSETDEDEPPKKRVKVSPKKATPKTTPKAAKTAPKTGAGKSRLSKGGKEVSEDEEPWETFIPKEDTPDAGDTKYQDESIHPNTLHFLKGTSPCYLFD